MIRNGINYTIDDQYAPLLDYVERYLDGKARRSHLVTAARNMAISVTEASGMAKRAVRIVEAVDRWVGKSGVSGVTATGRDIHDTVGACVLCPLIFYKPEVFSGYPQFLKQKRIPVEVCRGEQFIAAIQNRKENKEFLTLHPEYSQEYERSEFELNAEGDPISTGKFAQKIRGIWTDKYIAGYTCQYFDMLKADVNPNSGLPRGGSPPAEYVNPRANRQRIPAFIVQMGNVGNSVDKIPFEEWLQDHINQGDIDPADYPGREWPTEAQIKDLLDPGETVQWDEVQRDMKSGGWGEWAGNYSVFGPQTNVGEMGGVGKAVIDTFVQCNEPHDEEQLMRDMVAQGNLSQDDLQWMLRYGMRPIPGRKTDACKGCHSRRIVQATKEEHEKWVQEYEKWEQTKQRWEASHPNMEYPVPAPPMPYEDDPVDKWMSGGLKPQTGEPLFKTSTPMERWQVQKAKWERDHPNGPAFPVPMPEVPKGSKTPDEIENLDEINDLLEKAPPPNDVPPPSKKDYGKREIEQDAEAEEEKKKQLKKKLDQLNAAKKGYRNLGLESANILAGGGAMEGEYYIGGEDEDEQEEKTSDQIADEIIDAEEEAKPLTRDESAKSLSKRQIREKKEANASAETDLWIPRLVMAFGREMRRGHIRETVDAQIAKNGNYLGITPGKKGESDVPWTAYYREFRDAPNGQPIMIPVPDEREFGQVKPIKLATWLDKVRGREEKFIDALNRQYGRGGVKISLADARRKYGDEEATQEGWINTIYNLIDEWKAKGEPENDPSYEQAREIFDHLWSRVAHKLEGTVARVFGAGKSGMVTTEDEVGDILAEVGVTVWDKFRQGRDAPGAYAQHASFFNWMFIIATHKLYDLKRHYKKAPKITFTDLQSENAEGEALDENDIGLSGREPDAARQQMERQEAMRSTIVDNINRLLNENEFYGTVWLMYNINEGNLEGTIRSLGFGPRLEAEAKEAEEQGVSVDRSNLPIAKLVKNWVNRANNQLKGWASKEEEEGKGKNKQDEEDEGQFGSTEIIPQEETDEPTGMEGLDIEDIEDSPRSKSKKKSETKEDIISPIANKRYLLEDMGARPYNADRTFEIRRMITDPETGQEIPYIGEVTENSGKHGPWTQNSMPDKAGTKKDIPGYEPAYVKENKRYKERTPNIKFKRGDKVEVEVPTGAYIDPNNRQVKRPVAKGVGYIVQVDPYNERARVVFDKGADIMVGGLDNPVSLGEAWVDLNDLRYTGKYRTQWTREVHQGSPQYDLVEKQQLAGNVPQEFKGGRFVVHPKSGYAGMIMDNIVDLSGAPMNTRAVPADSIRDRFMVIDKDAYENNPDAPAEELAQGVPQKFRPGAMIKETSDPSGTVAMITGVKSRAKIDPYTKQVMLGHEEHKNTTVHGNTVGADKQEQQIEMPLDKIHKRFLVVDKDAYEQNPKASAYELARGVSQEIKPGSYLKEIPTHTRPGDTVIAVTGVDEPTGQAGAAPTKGEPIILKGQTIEITTDAVQTVQMPVKDIKGKFMVIDKAAYDRNPDAPAEELARGVDQRLRPGAYIKEVGAPGRQGNDVFMVTDSTAQIQVEPGETIDIPASKLKSEWVVVDLPTYKKFRADQDAGAQKPYSLERTYQFDRDKDDMAEW